MLSVFFVILLTIWFLALVAAGLGGIIHVLLADRGGSVSNSSPLPPD